jgi:sugar/nucleoside kinase (ribokinase family)
MPSSFGLPSPQQPMQEKSSAWLSRITFLIVCVFLLAPNNFHTGFVGRSSVIQPHFSKVDASFVAEPPRRNLCGRLQLSTARMGSQSVANTQPSRGTALSSSNDDNAASAAQTAFLTYHVIGDAYVDIFSFLDDGWPENGGDSRLSQPVKQYAGGSSTNTATHLNSLIHNFPFLKDVSSTISEMHNHVLSSSPETSSEAVAQVVHHTVFNPDDDYGRVLVEHAKKHKFPVRNCRKLDDHSWTGHCIAIVSGGERSFMTHQGCVGNFQASDVDVECIIHTAGHVHIHVAGFFNVGGFWNGNLRDQLARIRRVRAAQYPQYTTTVSLVTQHDATKQWDGGLVDVIPYLDFLVMNEIEADRVLQQNKRRQNQRTNVFGRLAAGPIPEISAADGSSPLLLSSLTEQDLQWIRFFSPLNPRACVIVTKGAAGAIAFRNHQVLATLTPAVSVDVIDPTGAGDSFTAGLLHGLWSYRRQLEEPLSDGGTMRTLDWTAAAVRNGLEFGCAVGTTAVTIRGASIPAEPSDIQRLFRAQHELQELTTRSMNQKHSAAEEVASAPVGASIAPLSIRT